MAPKKGIGFLVAMFIIATQFLQSAGAVVIDFEDLALDSSIGVGGSFIVPGVQITGEQFQWSNETWYDGGTATIEDGGLADGAGHELHSNNINLNFHFDIAVDGLAIQYGEYGGNLNIQVNDTFFNFDNFADIDNSSIGGALIFTLDSGTAGNSSGAIFIIGNIDTLFLVARNFGLTTLWRPKFRGWLH